MYANRIARWLWAVVVGCGAAAAAAQGPPPPALDFAEQLRGSGLLGEPVAGKPLKLSAQFTIVRGSREGKLAVVAEMPAGWHTYALTQQGGPGPSKLEVSASPEIQLLGPFQPDPPPKSRIVTDDRGRPIWDVPVLEHYERVTWTAPIRIGEDVDPEQQKIEVVFSGQVCQESGTCVPIFGERVAARFAGYEEPPAATGRYRSPHSHVELRGAVSPAVVRPGDGLKIAITAVPDPPYHIYALADADPRQGNKPTLIAITSSPGWPMQRPAESTAPVEGEAGQRYHESAVTWTIEVQVPKDAAAGRYSVSGWIGYQACTESTCDIPTAAAFRGTIEVGTATVAGEVPLAFDAGPSYTRVAQAAEKMQWGGGATDKAANAPWSNMPLPLVFTLAFLAGLILNVMPCVLPVIGLKIMSFVQQAGESRLRILQLNLWFSLGLLVVFWALATVPVLLNLLGRETIGWGGQFSYAPFSITLMGIVFVFALSFLGVWEVPVPGFATTGESGGVAQREGAAGAFVKGMLATVLATPCTGPLLGPVLGFAILQPPWVTYTTFTFIGLGMAFPYLLIGAFPRLIALLPKPGAWMETFKQLMGFVLLAAVVWIASFIDERYLIRSLWMLLGLALSCWIVGRVPAYAELSRKLTAWGAAVVVGALAALLAFAPLRTAVPIAALVVGGLLAIWLTMRAPSHGSWSQRLRRWGGAAALLVLAFVVAFGAQRSDELPYRPFDRVELEKLIKEGHTVLVDFTADW